MAHFYTNRCSGPNQLHSEALYFFAPGRLMATGCTLAEAERHIELLFGGA